MAAGLATRQEPPGGYMRCMIEAGTDPNTAKLLYMLLQDCVTTAAKIKLLKKDYSLTQEQSNERANDNSMHRQ